MFIRINNKKGFSLLPETVLKIVIAAICLAILFGLLGKLYFSNLENKELDQAKKTLNRLEQELNDMKQDQIRDFSIYSPKKSISYKWTILYFDSGLPKDCSGKCICICDGDNKDSCNELGTCIDTNFNLEQNKEINNVPVLLEIDFNKKTIFFK